MFAKIRNSIAIMILLSVSVYGDAITFKAAADKNKVALNDYFVYSLTVSGESANFPEPQMGDMADFNIYGTAKSQNITFNNGKRSNSATYRYTLVPKKMGKFTIPPAKLEYEKRTYLSEPISIEVTEAEKIQSAQVQQQSPAAQRQRGGQPGEMQKGNLFVKASADKKRAYVNEKVVYKFSFYTNVDLVSNPAYSPPDFKGFWNDLSKPKNRYEAIDGVNYLVNEIETTLYPIESGALTINPAKLKVAVLDFSSSGSAGDFFNLFVNMGQRQEKVLETDSVTVNVMPLPKENVPAEFKGAVGSFKISAELEKTEAKTGEPVSLNVKVTGNGNMKSVNDVNFEPSKDFRVYDTVSANITEDSREFQILIVPLSPGEKTVPPVKLTYFDPLKKAYLQAQTQPVKIKAEGAAELNPENSYTNGAAGALRINDDVNYNKQIKKIKSYYGGYLVENKFFWISFAPFIMFFILTLCYKFYAAKKNNDPVGRLKAAAEERSKKCIAGASAKIDKEKCRDFYDTVYDALTAAVTARTGEDADNLSVSAIAGNLKKSGLEEEKIKQTEELLNGINFFRFASVKSDEKSMGELLQKVIEISNILRNS
jgi:hypothetical protein